MPTSAISAYARLAIILRSQEGGHIRHLDQEMRSREPASIFLILTSRSSRMINVGPLITATDRGLRRAVPIFGHRSSYAFYDYEFGDADYYYLGSGPGDRPRPIPPDYGGLELSDAVPGSFHMLVTAYGNVLSLLT